MVLINTVAAVMFAVTVRTLGRLTVTIVAAAIVSAMKTDPAMNIDKTIHSIGYWN